MIIKQSIKRQSPKVCIFSDEFFSSIRSSQIDDWCNGLSDFFSISYNCEYSKKESDNHVFEWCAERDVELVGISSIDSSYDLCLGFKSIHFCSPYVLRKIKSSGAKSCIVLNDLNFLDYEKSAICSGLVDYVLIFDYSPTRVFSEEIYLINPMQKIIKSQDIYSAINSKTEDGVHVFFNKNEIDELKNKFFINKLRNNVNLNVSYSSVSEDNFLRKILIFYAYDYISVNDLRKASALAYCNSILVFLPEIFSGSHGKFLYFSSIEDLIKKINNIDIFKSATSELPDLKSSFLNMIQGL
jgi:hypothetical protein